MLLPTSKPFTMSSSMQWIASMRPGKRNANPSRLDEENTLGSIKVLTVLLMLIVLVSLLLAGYRRGTGIGGGDAQKGDCKASSSTNDPNRQQYGCHQPKRGRNKKAYLHERGWAECAHRSVFTTILLLSSLFLRNIERET